MTGDNISHGTAGENNNSMLSSASTHAGLFNLWMHEFELPIGIKSQGGNWNADSNIVFLGLGTELFFVKCYFRSLHH